MSQCMVQVNLFGKNILNKMIKFLDLLKQDKNLHKSIIFKIKKLLKKVIVIFNTYRTWKNFIKRKHILEK